MSAVFNNQRSIMRYDEDEEKFNSFSQIIPMEGWEAYCILTPDISHVEFEPGGQSQRVKLLRGRFGVILRCVQNIATRVIFNPEGFRADSIMFPTLNTQCCAVISLLIPFTLCS